VYDVDNTNGTWEFSTDGGTNWSTFGSPNENNVRLLAADADTYVRFVPNANFNGGGAAIGYRVWDQTVGTAGGTIGMLANWGSWAFSLGGGVASITVNPVNDAPVLTPAAPTLTTITEDETSNPGQTVALFIGTSISDVDSGAVQGIAITGLDNGNGSWEYSTNSGTNWNAVGAVADSSALLLRSSDLVRFVPDAQNATSGSITYRAWDQTSGSAGTKVDAGTNGGTTAFSTATDTAGISVTAVNDAPQATNLNAAETYTEDTPLNLTDIVVSDVDSANVSVILTLSDVAAGTLSTGTSGAVTSTFVGGVWTAAGAIADVNALLAGVTFTPAANFNSNFSIATSVDDGVAPAVTGSKAFTGNAVDDPATISGDIIYNGNEGDAVAGDMDATDVDGLTDGTYFTVSAQGANGTASIDPATGVWTFTPTDSNWFGSDTFTVTVTDDQGGTTNQGVNITLANVDDAATISGDISYNGNEGDAVGGNMNATDVDGLTDGTYFLVTTDPANGTASIDAATGLWTFSPADLDWFGSDNFTVTVTDDQGGTTTQVINIILANVNDAAVISGDVSYSGNEGDTATGNFDATDPDGLTGGNYAVTTDPSNGTAIIDPDTGAWTFAPINPNWFGTDSFTVTVTDDQGGTTTQVVNIILVDVDDAQNPGGGDNHDGDDHGGDDQGNDDQDDDDQGDDDKGDGDGSGNPGDPPSIVPTPPSKSTPPTPPGPHNNGSTPSWEIPDSDMTGDQKFPSDMAAVLKDLLPKPAQPTTAQAEPNTGFFSADALTLTLDRIQQQIDLSMASDANQGNMIIGAAAGLGVPVFAGYVIWALRGTSLLVGALSAMPMWRCFDPLPILSGEDEDKKKKTRPKPEDDEDTVKDLLDSGQADSSKQKSLRRQP
jgi:hypothetical protein